MKHRHARIRTASGDSEGGALASLMEAALLDSEASSRFATLYRQEKGEFATLYRPLLVPFSASERKDSIGKE